MKQLSYTLFVEKFRPQNVNGVLLPTKYKNFFQSAVKNGEVPNLLLHSSYPGSGKTTMAKALCNDIESDSMYINVSEDSGIDTLRNDIRRFASGKSLTGKKKIVILDELDGGSKKIQDALRGFIEEFQNKCRFIATCNYVNKIISPLRSRFQEFDFNMNTLEIRKEMIPKVVAYCIGLLKHEKITFDEEAVKCLVTEKYPDIRKIYNILQQYSLMNGHIDMNVLNYSTVDEKLYQLILDKKLTAARQFILDSGYDYDELYTDLFKNFLNKIEDKAKQAEVILILGEWQKWSGQVADKELNFIACLVNIMREL